MSESVQTSVSGPDVAMEDAVNRALASSSGQSRPGEAPAQERLTRVDTDEEMYTISAKIITVLTRYRPIVLELI